jgi:hypothetical protein
VVLVLTVLVSVVVATGMNGSSAQSLLSSEPKYTVDPLTAGLDPNNEPTLSKAGKLHCQVPVLMSIA